MLILYKKVHCLWPGLLAGKEKDYTMRSEAEWSDFDAETGQ
jgi:hypothetical protein